ncbi:tRNA N6-adenosine threonylcarbamoyltransferase [Parastagonospora nodorum]|nr:tRNA N6-adenosine threonylcarbamoyltransferase [Parastagonospora nodorum]KAH4208186.1 tRNA N6-adenosine threonylcarbamoyltransferase [Parastagonospora nodorum]KAH4273979.1 tRNA N6-adenosine threonylcarbamoyltransferase [Parastagonospora nodorum]KAH4283785.1 tRNA N6-adenosine threonylcarbamoyltransferase [Parastagonospora nodorum]KAH4297565.1 tRNA N6-adenosine threonylcarbamoyltransferase [Parastagonospora nodorum]
MRLRPIFRTGTTCTRASIRPQWSFRRQLVTLAIETSCDDTSVAIVEKSVENGRAVAQLHFHKKVTANNAEYQGVHPLVSLRSHQENLADLVSEAISHLPPKTASHDHDFEHGGLEAQKPEAVVDVAKKRLPDFVSVTRGPGMRSNLFTGLDTAKGLAVAWQIPLVGVHHMQAHALTPRLVSALEPSATPTLEPDFPFLSVLASGGHTLLIQSASLNDHHLLGTTNDIAVGEYLDKVARILLPTELLQSTRSTMYGALLEKFAFEGNASQTVDSQKSKSTCNTGSAPRTSTFSSATASSSQQYLDSSSHDYTWYKVPPNHEEALKTAMTKWGWAFNQPLVTAHGGLKVNDIELSFSGLLTAVERVIGYQTDPVTRKRTKIERTLDEISLEEKKHIAREAMRAAFEHVAYRVVLALRSLASDPAPRSVVLAGGVAANSFLRHILASTLCARGFSHINLYFPPPSFCTDNAAMIAWTGIEMFEAGHTDTLSIRAIRKWPLNQLLDPVVDG